MDTAQTGAVLAGFESRTWSIKIKAYIEKIAMLRFRIINATNNIEIITSGVDGTATWEGGWGTGKFKG